MMGQISRALLCFMMLLTGLSAAEAARVDNAACAGSEELSLVADQQAVGALFGVVAIASAPCAIASHADIAAQTQIAGPIATLALHRTTPLSRHDLARE